MNPIFRYIHQTGLTVHLHHVPQLGMGVGFAFLVVATPCGAPYQDHSGPKVVDIFDQKQNKKSG